MQQNFENLYVILIDSHSILVNSELANGAFIEGHKISIPHKWEKRLN